jgi:hypothetical protein
MQGHWKFCKFNNTASVNTPDVIGFLKPKSFGKIAAVKTIQT